MAKLVDAPHSKCGEVAPHVGSSPTPPIKLTKTKHKNLQYIFSIRFSSWFWAASLFFGDC